MQFQKVDGNILLYPYEHDRAFRKRHDTETQWENCKAREFCVPQTHLGDSFSSTVL